LRTTADKHNRRKQTDKQLKKQLEINSRQANTTVKINGRQASNYIRQTNIININRQANS
jgi:hypothetical protein